ncbi:MAG: TIR domain-containing protein [Phycisphaerae bacterium]|nr:TIR domain-containing protein [Phycisphaerae bacterium]
MPYTHKVFLSYSHDDCDDVGLIARFLKLIGVPVWFDETEGPFAGQLPQTLRAGIDRSEFFAFVQSENTARASAYLQLEAAHFRSSRSVPESASFILLKLSPGSLPPALAEYAIPITDAFDFSVSFLDGLSKLARFFRPSESGILKYFPRDRLIPGWLLDMLIEKTAREICLMGHSMAGVLADSRDKHLIGAALERGVPSARLLLLTPNLPRLQQLREAQMGLRQGTALHEKILQSLELVRNLKTEHQSIGQEGPLQVRVTSHIMYSKLYLCDSLAVVTGYSSIAESGDNSPAFLVHDIGDSESVYSFHQSEFDRCWNRAMHPEDASRSLELNDTSRILSHRDHVSHISRWLSVKEDKLWPPSMLIVYPTYQCSISDHQGNSRPLCRDCAYARKRGNHHLPFDLLERILGDAVREGVDRIEFSGGGEPLQYRYIEDLLGLVETLKKDRRDIIFGLLTNGFHLSDGKRAGVAQAFTYVRFSYADAILDDEDLESRFLDPFRSFLSLVQPSPTPRVGLKFLVRNGNAGRLVEKMLQLRKAIGQDLFMRIHHIRVKALRSDKPGKPPRASDCAAFKHDFYDHIFADRYRWPEDVQVDLDTDDLPEDFRCRLSPLAAVVDPHGAVWPCCNYLDMTTNERIGDWKSHSLREFWGTSEHRDILLRIRPRIACNARNGTSCRFARYQEVLENSLPSDGPSIPWSSSDYL